MVSKEPMYKPYKPEYFQLLVGMGVLNYYDLSPGMRESHGEEMKAIRESDMDSHAKGDAYKVICGVRKGSARR